MLRASAVSHLPLRSLCALSATLVAALVTPPPSAAHAQNAGWWFGNPPPYPRRTARTHRHSLAKRSRDADASRNSRPKGKGATTDRLALVRARRGQGLFRDRVARIESRCRITGVENPAHLVASHCKPWRDATNEERLDGENGLLLTPTIDHLFDRGFIGFEDDGRLILSPVAHRPSLQRMGINVTAATNVGSFTSGQRTFLEFHRQSVLLQSILR